MKNIYKLCSFLLVVLMCFVLTSCGSVKGSMSITAKRTSFDVTVTISDPDEKVGKVSCTIYENVDGEEEQVDTEQVSINSSGKGTISFEDLEVETEYVIYLYANINGNKKKLDKQTATTVNSGTEEEPYLIYTFDDLCEVSKDEEAHYVLMNDIDCEGENITPLFDSTTPFVGSFDGNGHTISNFNFYVYGSDYTGTISYAKYSGLFGYNKGTIKNLKIDNVKSVIKLSTAFVGIVCGINYGEISNVDLNNVTLEAPQTGSGWNYVGAITGKNADKATITDCDVTNLTINATSRNKVSIGGLVGWNAHEDGGMVFAPVIENCSVSGVINNTGKNSFSSTINKYIGGIAGYNIAKINNSVADIEINSTEVSTRTTSSYSYETYIGGLVGYVKAGTVSNSAVKAQISYESADVEISYVGGIAGYVKAAGYVGNCVLVSADSAITISQYALSTSASDTRYVSLSNGEYVLLSECYYYNGEQYLQLTSSTIAENQEIYKKSEDTYTLVSTTASKNLYKHVAAKDAKVGTGVGCDEYKKGCKCYQTAELQIEVKGNEYVVSSCEVATSYTNLSDAVLAFINQN